MADGRTFQDLMERIRGGSEEAFRELVRTYGPHILRLVRRRLSHRLRSQFDSADFEQSVWASFLAAPLDEYVFDRPEALIGFLVRVANNKVVDAVRRRLQAQKRDPARERSLDGSAAQAAGRVADRGPTPSQVAIARERYDELQRRANTPGRQILALLRQGYSQSEVAGMLGVSTKTIQRLVRALQGSAAHDPGPGGQPPGP